MTATAQKQLTFDAPHDAAAEAFHEANPHVYETLVALCREEKARGIRRWGIKAAWEAARYTIRKTTGEEPKMNNNYTAWYARRIMACEPDLAGFFQTRDRGVLE